MREKIKMSIGIILFHNGPFGGATKRFMNLYKYIYLKNNVNIYFFLNNAYKKQVEKIITDCPKENLIVIRSFDKIYKSKIRKNSKYYKFKKTKNICNVETLDNELQYSIFRKFFWFIKNYHRQRKIFIEIDKYRKKLDIKSFLGVFNGVIPLYFYLKRNKRPGIIFSDMDSWFYGIHKSGNKFWYRKFYSFNYGLENSDWVDFLSPFVLNGVRERGLNIKDEAFSITPCSFIDYSKCKSGKKKNFEIAFAGRLEPDKNAILFLEAVKIISNKFTNIKFHILGNGLLNYEVDNFIKENKLEERINYGFHKNPPEIFAETSIFVSIQTTNNYPSQSVLEAMACGNAIIASDVGDTRMFINENNGILIYLDVHSLVKAMEKLINNRELTRNLGKYASEYVRRNHTIEKAAGYYLGLFERAYQKINRH